MKENLNCAMNRDVDDCLGLEATHHIHCGQTEDHREAPVTRATFPSKQDIADFLSI
jgi:hypothetical protein